MTKLFIASAVSATFIASAQPHSAQRAHASKPAAATTTHGPSSHGATSAGPGLTPKPTAPTHGAKPTTSGHGSKTTAPSHGSKPTKPAHADEVAKTASTSRTTTTTSSSARTPLTPVQQKLQKNTQLAAKVLSRLPAGTDLMAASDGFKNLGQFVAAANVSHNLGIPFDQLKASMVDEGASLGQSILTLKKSANSDLEAQRAEREANTMISEAETVSPSKTPKSAKTKPGTTSHAPHQ
jgi:hypothetical protein